MGFTDAVGRQVHVLVTAWQALRDAPGRGVVLGVGFCRLFDIVGLMKGHVGGGSGSGGLRASGARLKPSLFACSVTYPQ